MLTVRTGTEEQYCQTQINVPKLHVYITQTGSALEIRTKKLRAKVAPNSEKLGATLKSWGPS